MEERKAKAKKLASWVAIVIALTAIGFVTQYHVTGANALYHYIEKSETKPRNGQASGPNTTPSVEYNHVCSRSYLSEAEEKVWGFMIQVAIPFI